MQTIFGILVAILVFGIMIFLHELGHYLAARACKVKVLEFAVGMGPKIISKTSKRSGIVYSLRLLPIGGVTAMQGEDGEDPDPDALVNKPRWQKLIVLFAGSFFNLVSGVIVMFVFLLLTGSVGSSIIYDFSENSSSDRWLRPGDEIVAIEGKKMIDYTDVANTITLDGVEPLDITVIRDEEKIVLEDVEFPTAQQDGITTGVLDFRFLGVKPSLGVLLKQTGTQSVATVKMIYKTLIDLVSGRYGMNGVSGPVGTVSIISEVAQTGFVDVLYLFSFISLNLGIMNLLPLPALDGGRILFTLVECVIRRPINPKFEGYVHLAGMAVLLLFMAFITVFDVLKLI
ncbi:MAG: site-2 protease family protein [Clostridia bacterium]|nr:site-2 protease family protein [Clostridia bacterium]